MLRRRHIAPVRGTLLLPCALLLLALGLALWAALWPARAIAGNIVPADTRPDLLASAQVSAMSQSLEVAVQQPAATTATDGVLRVNVSVTTALPADYLEVRLRVRSDSGTLVYQKTQVRMSAASGMSVFVYEYDLSSLNLSPGRYPIEVRVRATGADPVTATGRVLLIDANANPLPVAVVLRCEETPSAGFGGTFAEDPASQLAACATITSVARFVTEHGLPISLAIAPVTLDEFARASAGYETTAGASVAADSAVPRSYATMLGALASAVASGTIDLLDSPYALPDLAQTPTDVTAADLARQWAHADSLLGAVVGSTAASSTAYFGDAVSAEGIATLAARNDTALLVPAGSLRSGDATLPAGCYALSGSDVRVLVADERLAGSSLSGPDAFYDALFAYVGTNGVVLMLDIGEGSAYGADNVQRVLDLIAGAPWLVLTDLDALGRTGTLETMTLSAPSPSSPPSEYWYDIAAARTSVLAYVAAAGADDADASEALRALLVSESSLLAGDGGSWRDAPFGLQAASDARAYATGQFALVHLNIMDITLSDRHGNVPVTIVNDTGKQLTLTLSAESAGMSVGTTSTVLTVLPDENFVTIPVSLGNALSGDLHVSLVAGDLTITDTIVHVKASYIDRLATVGMVVIVLVGLLFYIHRRVRPADGEAAQDTPGE